MIGAPVAVALGAPALGCAIGGVAWIAQRILAETDKRWTAGMSDPRRQLAFNLFEGFGRIWLLAGAIVIAGVAGSRPDGLAAALVIFGAYSVAFLIRVASGPPSTGSAPRNRERAAMSRLESLSTGKKIGYSVLAIWLLGIVFFAIIYGVSAHKAPTSRAARSRRRTSSSSTRGSASARSPSTRAFCTC